MPTPRNVHVDRILTNMSVGFMQERSAFVAGRIFPVVPVNEASGIYAKYPRGFFWRDEMRPRPLGGELERADYEVETATFKIEEWGVSHYVDDRVRRNASRPFDPNQDAAFLLSEMAAINAERRWASAFFTTGVWTTDLSGVSSNPGSGEFLQWDQSDVDPADEIRGQKITMADTTGFEGNVLVVGIDVWRALANNAEMKDQIKYTQTGVLSEGLVADLMGLDELVVARSVYNSAEEGQDDSITRIVGRKDALLLYRTPRPGLRVPTAGLIFAWSNLVPGATNVLGAVVERGRVDTKYSDYFAIRNALDFEVVSPDLGIFFEDAVA